MTYVLDTHALVWFLEDNPRLSASAKEAILNPKAHIIIPTIVLTEVVFLYSKKRIASGLPAVLSELGSLSNCTVYPLDEQVVLKLPANLDIHDAIIVATGLLYRDLMGHNVSVITKDETIKRSKLIKTVW